MPNLEIHVSSRLNRRIAQVAEEQGFSSKADFIRFSVMNQFQEMENVGIVSPAVQSQNPRVQPAPTYPNHVVALPNPTFKKKPTTIKDLKNPTIRYQAK